MNINDSVDWNIDRRVGATVGKGIDGRVESDVDGKFGSGDGEGF